VLTLEVSGSGGGAKANRSSFSGTNTDSVLLSLSKPGTSAVLSFNKSPTTPDVTKGVKATLKALFTTPCAASSEYTESKPGHSSVEPTSVAALAIGTTHFLNAIIQHDAARLSRVAVIRLGSHNFLDGALPFADWPGPLRRLIEGYSAIVPGGVNIDGRLVGSLDESSLRAQARKIHACGLQHVVIVGMGSPMDQNFSQEATAKELILSEMKILDSSYARSVDFVLSHTVAGSGLLARENASILNAAILTFARQTVHSFIRAMRNVGLQCPLYLTSNAGHLLPFSEAVSFPIRIFSSGATNSMRGAAFLAREQLRTTTGPVVVVDVGGTTSDVGALLPNGYPRLSQTFTDLAGVKINLDMPSVDSIGLGGGSIVRVLEESSLSPQVTVGPDSVGYALTTEALSFGGQTPTATDIAISISSSDANAPALSIGDSSRINLSPALVAAAQQRIKYLFESLIDRIRLSADDCTVILVGGGAILCPPQLRGVGRIIRSEYAGVANAIGAALAKIYGSAEAFVDAEHVQTGTSKVTEAAIENAVSKGADRLKGFTVLNETIQWVPYVDRKRLIRIEVACEADHAKVYKDMVQSSSAKSELISEISQSITVDEKEEITLGPKKTELDMESTVDDAIDLASYRPEISPLGEWLVSPIDLKFLEIGCYILGCGGGGSPYATYLALLEQLRDGQRIAITSPDNLSDNAVLPSVAAIGTPAVSLERINSLACFHAIEKLSQLCDFQATHMLACEIGGMNGLATLQWASQRYCNVPAVDGDLMGESLLTSIDYFK
jgi:N-methylhydantoinase A/oxoprolinase/acetone carboxylase beta subunit